MKRIDVAERLHGMGAIEVGASLDDALGPAPAEPMTGEIGPLTLAQFAVEARQELVGLAYTLCGSREEAQDIVQEVMLKLALKDLAEIRDLATYARRAVYNESSSLGRRWGRGAIRRTRLVEEWQRTLRVQPDPHGRVEVMAALSRLPERQRAALVLRYYVDLPDQEIAAILSCAPPTVRTLLARGLRKLRLDLEEPS